MDDGPDTKELKRLCESLGWEHRMHQTREHGTPKSLVMVYMGEAAFRSGAESMDDMRGPHMEAYGRHIEDACTDILAALNAVAHTLDTYAHEGSDHE